jgi:mono/diheme cytochrome c family protein
MNENIDYQPTMNVAAAHSAVARENVGVVKTSDSPIGNLPIVLGAIVMICAGSYIGGNWAGGSPEKPEGLPSAGVELAPDVKWKKDGAAVYSQACQGCHGPGGAGNAGSGFPPLAGSEWVTGSEKRLLTIILKGLAGPISVKGITYGSAVMPAKGGVNLNDKQIAQVMSYVRNEWGNSGSLVMADQVKEYAAAIAAEASPYKSADLDKIPATDNLPPSKKPLAPAAAAPAAK